eukprot:4112128-Amphidinium_carterae.2
MSMQICKRHAAQVKKKPACRQPGAEVGCPWHRKHGSKRQRTYRFVNRNTTGLNCFEAPALRFRSGCGHTNCTSYMPFVTDFGGGAIASTHAACPCYWAV